MHKNSDKVSKYFKGSVQVVFRTEFIGKLGMILLRERKNKACSIISSIFQDKWSFSLLTHAPNFEDKQYELSCKSLAKISI